MIKTTLAVIGGMYLVLVTVSAVMFIAQQQHLKRQRELHDAVHGGPSAKGELVEG